MNFFIKYCLLIFTIISCSTSDDVINQNYEQNTSELYFPSTVNSDWETTELESLGWNEDELPPLLSFLDTNNTRAFIVLYKGKIVIEEYWGNNFQDTAPFDAASQWYWASAGKTITATLVGAAQKIGLLNIDDKTSDYLGTGWSSIDLNKENLITIKDQLQMTTGLDYNISNLNCTNPECLIYGSDAGTQWYYHNAPYTLLANVVSQASGQDYNLYTDQNLESAVGMNGLWNNVGFNNVYWSTARDMARFGLLTLNKGVWENNPAIYDLNYYTNMINSSQHLNPSYGYLWWLNGKDSIIFPGFETAVNTELSANAPSDMYSALGKNGQILDIIPSQNIIVVRMGEAPGDSLVPVAFHNEMWELLNKIMTN